MRQFPDQITSTITIYPRFIDPLTNNHINVRCVLKGCFWNENSVSIFQKTGQQVANSVEIYIPYRQEISGLQYISPDEWLKKDFADIGKYWTVDPQRLPLVINEDFPFTFNWNTSAQITRDEAALRASNRNIRQVTDVNAQLFGSINMQHVLLRC
jgi:hypothetical protein